MISKIIFLLNNPGVGLKKVIPYIQSRLFAYRRLIAEARGSDEYSKPYPGHEELLKFIDWRGGFFVQCGGYDGYFQDPTYYLEKFRGWRGLILEPTARFRDCAGIRGKSTVLNVAAVGDPEVSVVTITGCEAMSVIEDEKYSADNWTAEADRVYAIYGKKSSRTVAKAQTLNAVLAERGVNEIDLLVLDTEGSEADILRGLDLRRVNVRYALIEIHTGERQLEVESILGGRLLAKLVGNDYLYEVGAR